MRWHVGRVPEQPDFHPERDGWRRLREPGPLLMQLLALPIAAAVFVLLGGAVVMLGMERFWQVHPGMLVAIFAGMIPAHELTHVLAHPGQGRSPDSVVGFWPATLLFYAHYDQSLSRDRFLLILGLPFLVLSILPIVVCGLMGWRSPSVGAISVFNGVLSCGDLFGIGVLLCQVPQAATVRNQGYRTWWTVDAV